MVKMKLNDQKREAMVDFCCALVKTPSIHGDEGGVAHLLKEELQRLGYETCMDDWGNVWGVIKARDPKERPLLIDCHLDTVGVGEEGEWNYPPFGAEIVGETIYGRGTADMKGAIAAAVYGLSSLSPEDLKRDVYVCGSISEEIQEGAGLRYVIEDLTPGIVIIGESSNLDLMVGQRGRGELHIFTKGVSAHSSTPYLGVNAIRKMMKVLEALNHLELPTRDDFSSAIMELTDIKSTPYPAMSVLPHLCEVTYDRRLLPGEEEEEVLGAVTEVLEELMDEDPDLKAWVEIGVASFTSWTGRSIEAKKFAKGWYYSKEEDFVKKALSGLKEAGLTPSLRTYDFCTNGSLTAGELGIPTLGFGPGGEGRAHTVDEYITMEELSKAALGFRGLVLALAGV